MPLGRWGGCATVSPYYVPISDSTTCAAAAVSDGRGGMTTERPPSRLRRWLPPLRISGHGAASPAHLVGRIALLVLFVVVGDRVTVFMSHHQWTLDRDAVIAVRLFTALPIIRYPFEGFVVALEIDKWDWFWLAAGDQPEASQTIYQEWDKVLDLFVLAMGLVASLRWPDSVVRRLLLVTFALRVAGVAAFLLTEQRWFLVAFPNVFESLFLMYVVFRLVSGQDRMLTTRWGIILAFCAALVPKLVEEYFLHMLNRRPWDLVQLPIPDAFEPRIWIVAMYLPAVAVVLLLAQRQAVRDVDGSE